jgi:hypothetical protein
VELKFCDSFFHLASMSSSTLLSICHVCGIGRDPFTMVSCTEAHCHTSLCDWCFRHHGSLNLGESLPSGYRCARCVDRCCCIFARHRQPCLHGCQVPDPSADVSKCCYIFTRNHTTTHHQKTLFHPPRVPSSAIVAL